MNKGCKISDHGFLDFPIDIASDEEADYLFTYRDALDKKGHDCLFGYLLHFLMQEYQKRDGSATPFRSHPQHQYKHV